MTTTAIQDLLTPEQVAKELGRSRKWVLKQIAKRAGGDPDGLPAVNLSRSEGTGKRWGVKRSELDAWVTDWLNAA